MGVLEDVIGEPTVHEGEIAGLGVVAVTAFVDRHCILLFRPRATAKPAAWHDTRWPAPFDGEEPRVLPPLYSVLSGTPLQQLGSG